MSKLLLYAYSTEEYLKKGWIKVGETRSDIGEKRIWNQFGTSNPENPEYKIIGVLPTGKKDSHVRDILIKKMGCKKRENVPGIEWLEVPGIDIHDPFKIVSTALNELQYGISRPKKYKLRPEQLKAVEKADKWFSKKFSKDELNATSSMNSFLINAKMRFGKCFTSIHLAKKLNAKNTLIVTYKPDVISEWIETVDEQVDFSGWRGVRARPKNDRPNELSLGTDGSFPDIKDKIVLCVSFQDLEILSDGKRKKRLENIWKRKWDLVIFDEVHYGGRTPRAQKILSQLMYTRCLNLSGTPFRIIEQEDYSPNQVFTYSYLDEQANKKNEIKNNTQSQGEIIYRAMPDINICAIEISQSDIEDQREKFQTDDIDFSLNRLFSVDKTTKKFVHENAVDHFISGLAKSGHDARDISVYGKLGIQLKCPAIRHSVWWLDRVDSISALMDKLKKHPYFSKFDLVNASGSDKGKTENEERVAKDKLRVQKAISDSIKNNKLGTITFTCGRFLTGVTIKEWDSLLVLNDTQSAESYFQAMFRVQSSWIDEKHNKVIKENAWVFDFAIKRCLQLTHECASSIADQVEQQKSSEQNINSSRNDLDEITSGLCETLHIKRFYEGNLVSHPTSSREIFESVNYQGSKIALARRITSNFLVNFGKLRLLETHPDIYEILKNVKGYRTQNVKDISVENLVEIGKNNGDPSGWEDKPPKTKEQKKKKKVRDKNRDWYATQIKRLAICMADFIYMTLQREYVLEDVIQTKSPEFFNVMTGISKDDFVLLCNLGFIRKEALQRIVREFKHQEESSLQPDEYIYDYLYKMVA